MGNLVFQATLGGQVNLVGPNTASTYNINVPSVNGNLVTTGDTGTVTNTMLAGSIANAKLTNSSVTVGSTSIALGATSTTLASLTSVGSNLLTSAASTALTLQSAGTTAVTIDTSQNVGIGTSSPTQKLTVSGAIQATNNSSNFDQTGAQFDYVSGAGRISSYISTGSNLQFLTNPNGGASAERMRINSSGNLGIGTTSPATKLDVVGTIQSTASADTDVGFNLVKVSATVTAGTNKFIQFLTNNGGASTGFIASNGANNAGFFAGSDRRIKTDIQNVSDGVEKVMQLKPRKFKFKENNEQSHGFIAQELDKVFPECVYKPNDGLGEEVPKGQEPWAVNFDKLVPYLTAAIQELKVINDTQTETINALITRVMALEAK